MYDVVEDGAHALLEVKTERFFQTVKDPRTPVFSSTHGYLFRNTSTTRTHFVVPLFMMKKGVHLGMSVWGPQKESLVFLNSETCRSIAIRYCELLLERIASSRAQIGLPTLTSISVHIPKAITLDTAGKALAEQSHARRVIFDNLRQQFLDLVPPMVDFLNGHGLWPQADLKESANSAVKDVREPNLRKERLTQWVIEKDISPGPFVKAVRAGVDNQGQAEAFQPFEQFMDAVVDLVDFIERSLIQFVPFVVLHKPLAISGTAESFVYLEHQIQHEWTDPDWRIGREILRCWSCNYEVPFNFYLYGEAESSYFQALVSSGAKISYSVKKAPQPGSNRNRNRKGASTPFDKDMDSTFTNRLHDANPDLNRRYDDSSHGIWESQGEQSYTFFLPKDKVVKYTNLNAKAGKPEPLFQLFVNCHEDWTTRGLSVILAAFGIITAVQIALREACGGLFMDGPFLEGTVAIAVSLGLFAYEKPRIRGRVAGRMIEVLSLILLAVLARTVYDWWLIPHGLALSNGILCP